MTHLSRADVAAVMEVALAAYAFDGLESFRQELLPAIARLIPGDSSGYTELDLATDGAIVILDNPDATFTGMGEAFGTFAHQHPGVQLSQVGDFRPHTVSDLVTVDELHRLDIYQEVYRKLGMEDQIYFNLTESALVTIAINRSRRSFTARERELIKLLEPHLRRAYFQAHQRELAKAIIAAQQAGLDEADRAVILLDAFGHVVHASPLGRQLLATYWPDPLQIGAALPGTLATWLRATSIDTPNTLNLTRPCGRLRVQALSGRTIDGWRTLLLTEHPVDDLPDVKSLRTLGLTNRQAHVLRLLAGGHSTQTIADQLVLSPATVRKHLENIYTRIGARSRTEAVATALRHRPAGGLARSS
jgi:DNA-binding CsgD family transcriptional regulator